MKVRDVGGDGGAIAHGLGGLAGVDGGERFEERCAGIEVGAVHALEGLFQEEAEACRDFGDGDLVGHGFS